MGNEEEGQKTRVQGKMREKSGKIRVQGTKIRAIKKNGRISGFRARQECRVRRLGAGVGTEDRGAYDE